MGTPITLITTAPLADPFAAAQVVLEHLHTNPHVQGAWPVVRVSTQGTVTADVLLTPQAAVRAVMIVTAPVLAALDPSDAALITALAVDPAYLD